MGTSSFAVPALKALSSGGCEILSVVTQPDRPAGRGLSPKSSPVKEEALKMGLQVFQPEKIRDPQAVETLRKLNPDLVVVAAYGQILPPAVLNIPKTACLNIHGSLLPKYRGAAPIHYAVMAGETDTGVTLIYMNEKMDEGDILLTKKTAIGARETTGELHDRLAGIGAEGLLEALELLGKGKAPRTPQDHSKATYAPTLKREQCRLDWGKSAAEVANQVRGLCPWPSAETRWNGLDLKVFTALPDPGGSQENIPGKVLSIGHEGVRVTAGKGSVLLTEIQPPGKRRMSAHDFSLGHPNFKPGEILA